MTDRVQNVMTCSQFEALLAEALDESKVHSGAETGGGIEQLAGLPAVLRKPFAEHRESCPKCGPLYAETREGMLLLAGLEELEPPRNLLHNILAATSHVESRVSATGAQVQPNWLDRVRTRLVPSFAGALRSRFAASFCMAFFSLSLTLSLAGVKISDVAHMAVHPGELRKSLVLEYSQVQARVVRYYDNLRVVYEAESFAREIKKAAAPVPSEDKGTQQPDQQNWNQPAPGAPDYREVVQPQAQESYNNSARDRALRRFALAPIVPDGKTGFRKTAMVIADTTRKNEGAQI